MYYVVPRNIVISDVDGYLKIGFLGRTKSLESHKIICIIKKFSLLTISIVEVQNIHFRLGFARFSGISGPSGPPLLLSLTLEK